MRRAATAAGFYETEYGKCEKVQILTVEDLFDGKRPHVPWLDPSVFKKTKREKTESQNEMDVSLRRDHADARGAARTRLAADHDLPPRV